MEGEVRITELCYKHTTLPVEFLCEGSRDDLERENFRKP